MTADEPVAGVPRLCARRADCTRPRGHDDECGPDRADTELADLRAEVERLEYEAVLSAQVIGAEERRALSAEAERDAVQRQVDAVRALCSPFTDDAVKVVEEVAIRHSLPRAVAHAVVSITLRSVEAALDAVEPADQPDPTPEADER